MDLRTNSSENAQRVKERPRIGGDRSISRLTKAGLPKGGRSGRALSGRLFAENDGGPGEWISERGSVTESKTRDPAQAFHDGRVQDHDIELTS